MNITGLFLFKRSNGFWYVVFNEGGTRRWKSTKARKKQDALLFLTEFKWAMQPKPRRVLFSQFTKEFEEIEGPNLRESTLKGDLRSRFQGLHFTLW